MWFIIGIIIVVAILCIITILNSSSNSNLTPSSMPDPSSSPYCKPAKIQDIKETDIWIEKNNNTVPILIDGALGICWGENSNIVIDKMADRFYQLIDYQQLRPEIVQMNFSGKFADEEAYFIIKFFNDAVYEIKISFEPPEVLKCVALLKFREIRRQLEEKYGKCNYAIDLWITSYNKKAPDDFLIRSWDGKASNGDKVYIRYLPLEEDAETLIACSLDVIYHNEMIGAVAEKYKSQTKYDGL